MKNQTEAFCKQKNIKNKIVLTHFESWFYKDIKKARSMIQKLLKKNIIEIIIGYDGLEKPTPISTSTSTCPKYFSKKQVLFC